MHSFKKSKTFRLQVVLLLVLVCCLPITMKADVINFAIALAPSNILLAAGGLLTVLGLLRFKRKQQHEEE